MSRAWDGGSTRAWRRIRAAVLEANLQPPPVGNSGLCTLHIDGRTPCPKHVGRVCVAVCTGVADTAHHTHGRAKTGDDRRYLVASCAPCNLHIGEPRAEDPKGKGRTSWVQT